MHSPTHRVTIEHYTETGETVSDGMGGTRPVEEWTVYAEDVLARYTAGTGQANQRVRDVSGTIERAQPVVTTHPSAVGDVVDGTFECDVRGDGTWRVVVPGLAGEDRYKVVTNVREQYAFGSVPTAVALDLELQDD